MSAWVCKCAERVIYNYMGFKWFLKQNILKFVFPKSTLNYNACSIYKSGKLSQNEIITFMRLLNNVP